MQADCIVVYLDTNHLSTLGRHSEIPASASFRKALADSGGVIALSIVHLIELGNPSFKSSDLVCALLDELPVVWALPLDSFWAAEVSATYGAYFKHPLEVQPFGDDVQHAIGGQRLGVKPSLAVESFRDPAIRLEVEQATIAGLIFDAMKTDATLVQDPLILLKRMIVSRRPSMTPGSDGVEPFVGPADILRAVGGLRGFPSYSPMHTVATARLRDKTFRAAQSDVYDPNAHRIFSLCVIHCA